MSIPKIKPCPQCQNGDYIAVYRYENGWRHVECTKCNYLGPGEGSILAAVIEHNRRALLLRDKAVPVGRGL